MRVTVLCSGSESLSPIYLSESEELGRILAEHRCEVVTSGDKIGCTASLLSAVLRNGGSVVEFNSSSNEPSDLYLLYPGGLEVLAEFFGLLVRKARGEVRQPILCYNFMDTWTPLLMALNLLVEQKLINLSLSDLFHVLDKPSQLSDHLMHVQYDLGAQKPS